MTPLDAYVKPHARFARSANIERDIGTNTIEGYLPTGRGLDVIRRVTRGLLSESASRALSVTGPYGSGKSSLAVFLDALLAPCSDHSFLTAREILAAADLSTAELLDTGRASLGVADTGFVRAVATASREPVISTVVRALADGADRFRLANKRKPGLVSVCRDLRSAATGLADRTLPLPTPRFVLDAIAALGQFAPVLLLIDEFGKNLEAFADNRGEADLYLLQTLAEGAQGGSDALPLLMLTMQHLAFEDYVDISSGSQRREWAKIQGRFEDVPYVDTASQTRHLMAAVWEPSHSGELGPSLDRWAIEQLKHLRRVGLGGVVPERDVIRGCWPLHPVTMLVLPELCARYGQNERTLFSFLASGEPLAVPAWLGAQGFDRGRLPDVRPDRVYDYFVDSASTMINASQSAGRWLEIETTIRDAVGLSDAHRRALKTIGLLNLVSAGGALRASKAIITWVLADGETGSEDAKAVARCLGDLEVAGRITWRDFADEYRVWRGSDVDLKAALDRSRRALRDLSPASLLARARPLDPAVAARHSVETGTLRAFDRAWCDATARSVDPPAAHDPVAGLVLYVVDDGVPQVSATSGAPKPVVAIRIADSEPLLAAAIEVAAVREVAASEEVVGDLVARRELIEREAEAMTKLASAFEGAMSDGAVTAWLLLRAEAEPEHLARPRNLSMGLSAICDRYYNESPVIANELLNRHELSSQGAKARRELVEALVTRSADALLGIEGFGPDRTMYEAVLGSSGIHRQQVGRWNVGSPRRSSSLHSAWNFSVAALRGSRSRRLGFDQILDDLQAPPYGMTAGAAPVLLVSVLLAQAGNVALYEHGTYKPRLTPELCERLLRNPSHFQVKHFGADRGDRRETLRFLASALDPDRESDTEPTVLMVVRQLVSSVNALTPYARTTGRVSAEAKAVRQAVLLATEPDALLFDVLPTLLGYQPITAGSHPARVDDLHRYAVQLVQTLDELYVVHLQLLDGIVAGLREATAAPAEDTRTVLAVRAATLEGHVLDPKLRSLLSALRATELGDAEWAEYTGMVMVGPPPAMWTDDDRLRYATAVQEVGGTFRRLEALHFDRQAANATGFDAVRVTLTRPDGAEHVRVVTLDATQREALGTVADAALRDASRALGSDTQAREALLALLADQLQSEAHTEVTTVPHREPGTTTGSGTDG